MSSKSREQHSTPGVYAFMMCGCALVAYAGLMLPLLDNVPRTIQFESIDWRGSNPTEIVSQTGTIATLSDRSRANWIRGKEISLTGSVIQSWFIHSIYFRNSNTAYVIDDQHRSVHVIPCDCTFGQDGVPEDALCLGASRRVRGLTYVGSGEVAGFPVTRYRAVNTSEVLTISFAPTLHCQVMDLSEIVFGLGREKSYTRFIITEYASGKPSLSVFVPPSEYRYQTTPPW